MEPPEGAPIPGSLADCEPGHDEESSSGPEQILARLDELLADSGGAYSTQHLPIKQAIQYSIIALNKQNHEALMQLVQVLAAQIIGRNQYCEDVLSRLAAPFQRTIRGHNQRCSRQLNQLLGHLAQVVCARTTYCRQMLSDCQCRMLGASEPEETSPPGDGETGIPAPSQYSSGRPDTETTAGNSSPNAWTPNPPPVECQQWDICEGGYLWQWMQRFFQFHWPQIQHAIQRPPNISVNAQGGNTAPAIARANADEWEKIVSAAQSHDPDEALSRLFDTNQDGAIVPPPVGLLPSPVEEEHYPDELLPE